VKKRIDAFLIQKFVLLIFFLTGMIACKDDAKNVSLPDIGITAPPDKSTFTAGTDIKISSFATSANGLVDHVEFYQGTEKLGEDRLAPYEFVWSKVKAGDYTITVNSVDGDGNEMSSASITIKVVEPG
jgi:hypothetical protein